jgi:hypothetical protein
MAFREDPFMDNEFALPPLPATPLYNPNACQVVAHHDGSELILDAESTSIPESHFRTMFNFESNTQILCASCEWQSTAMMKMTTADENQLAVGCIPGSKRGGGILNTLSVTKTTTTNNNQHKIKIKFIH